MVDERGRDKNQICNGGRRAENEMRDNYRFILPVRASHFRSVSKTVSIRENLGCQHDWRTCCSRCGILDTSRKFRRKLLGPSSLRNEFIFLIADNSHSTLLQHHLYWTDLFTIRNRIDNSSLK
jgi:hypothetical protein